MNKENVNIGTYAVVDPGEGPGVPSPSLFPLLLDQTESFSCHGKNTFIYENIPFTNFYLFLDFKFINNSGFRICVKELFVQQFDPLTVSYAVLAGNEIHCIQYNN